LCRWALLISADRASARSELSSSAIAAVRAAGPVALVRRHNGDRFHCSQRRIDARELVVETVEAVRVEAGNATTGNPEQEEST
jgi:hypothetical protein